MDIRFDNKTAIVTGAGIGLGRSYALLLASRGARVVVNDMGGSMDGSGHSETPAQKVVDEIRAQGGEAVADYNDISSIQGAGSVVKACCDAYGKVDILINSAGILRDKSFAKMEMADFEKVISVHLLGTVYMTKAVYPIMLENKYGRIVNTTSAAGLYGNFGQTNYGAAKMGIVGFMNALKQEGAKHNILVNTVAPIAATRMGEGVYPEAVLSALKPELVAAVVAYLSSEQCTLSGEIISAGGGYYAKVQIVESRGVRFKPTDSVTPELIADRLPDITKMEGAVHFGSAIEEVMAMFKHLL
ncbi:MAG: SDR family oxidoreductase [Deltaproteobacteria bacterium]|nr:SDR family oxidoreductase [Deltaproteobacteria bacterium]MBN2686560.1 SDR family oxidoreductase [Deltaproteobacteria bacterium]